MSENILSFEGSNQWRERLVSKNLEPYKIPGVYQAPINSDFYYETELSTYEVKNSEDVSYQIDDEPKEILGYNKYGTDELLDGASLIRYPSEVSNSNTTPQEYSPKQTKFENISEPFINAVGVVNQFVPEEGYKDLFFVSDNILPKKMFFGAYPNFTPGSYTLADVAQGNFPSEDSYLQYLGVTFLKDAIQQRVDREIRRGLNNIVDLNALTNPFSLSQIVTGKQPLVGKIYTITVPDGLFDQGKFLLEKITGAKLPVSPIEGSYFQEPDNKKLSVRQLLEGAFSKFFKPADPNSNPSIKFLNNTGSGQKSVLFASLGYNTFKPPYEENKTQLGLLIDNIFDKNNSLANFYVGGETQDPSIINSPVSQTPVNYLGNQTQSIVLGPSNLSKIYESDLINNLKFGLNGQNMTDASLSDGGFVWTQKPLNANGEPSNASNPEARKAVGTSIDGGADYNSFGDYTGSVSLYNQSSVLTYNGDNPDFKLGSILDETQRLIDSAPRSGRERLVHAGNAINQVSKVFMDGYKLLTKGSRVKRYQFNNTTGQYEQKEFGRVFSKDRPYYYNSQLVKNTATSDGEDTNGNIRKAEYSVLDSTYNLNIAPYRGQDSTNVRDGRVKKYMFSIENLAWKNTPEFEDLPDCEKGQNGGRIMWFPPYNLSFDDQSTPTFNSNNFLGRPEPIYTYQNTKRSGNLSWSIIVDHPSVLNLIVDKELKDVNSENTANEIVNSFFAGLNKYDLYELAKKYSTIPFSDITKLYEEIIGNTKTPLEDKEEAANSLPPVIDNLTQTDGYTLQTDCIGWGFYFDTADATNLTDYDYAYLSEQYDSVERFDEYVSYNQPKAQEIEVFYDEIITPNIDRMDSLFNEVHEIFNNKIGRVKIILNSSLYQDTTNYGELTDQRLETIKKFFGENAGNAGNTLQDKLDSSELQIVLSPNPFPDTVIPIGDTTFNSINCLDILQAPDNDYSPQAMACRALRITQVIVTETPPEDQSTGSVPPVTTPPQGEKPSSTSNIENKSKNISKFILRKLLTECNYFDMLRAQDPFVFDNIRKKIKYFSPIFHSMTPEGLNSRVTFLNQCVRPGRTIPVKNTDGELVNQDAFNTAFGSPPVLVLRVGDYFNTKIIPGNISFKYENLDLNPEGIGVQPMIVNVTMSFDIIGGMGLKGPVDELQNALSFNFYANTEMYDDRATATEDTSALDENLLESIVNNNEPNSSNNTTQQSNGGGYIGKINTQASLNGKISGEIQYNTFFNSVVSQTQEYFSIINNFSKDMSTTYNYPFYYYVQKNVNFSNGFLNNLRQPESNSAKIFGKPSSWQENLNQLQQTFQTQIDNQEDAILSGLSNYSVTYLNIEQIQLSLKNLLLEKVSNSFGEVQVRINEVANSQVNYYQSLRKLDFICYSGDGKVLATGEPEIVLLTGLTENSNNTLNEISSDYNTIITNIQSFYDEMSLYEIILSESVNNYYVENFLALTPELNISEFYLYLFFSEDIIDPDLRTVFIDSITINTLSAVDDPQPVAQIVEDIVNGLAVKFQLQKDSEQIIYEDWEQSNEYLTFNQFNPVDINGVSLNTKERKMFFSNNTDIPQNYGEEIKNVYKTINVNNDIDTYVGKVTFN